MCKAPYQVPSERENKREKERERYRVSQTERETDRQKEVEMPDLGLPSLPSESVFRVRSRGACQGRQGQGSQGPCPVAGAAGPARRSRAYPLHAILHPRPPPDSDGYRLGAAQLVAPSPPPRPARP